MNQGDVIDTVLTILFIEVFTNKYKTDKAIEYLSLMSDIFKQDYKSRIILFSDNIENVNSSDCSKFEQCFNEEFEGLSAMQGIEKTLEFKSNFKLLIKELSESLQKGGN